jgi:hypothetical protein
MVICKGEIMKGRPEVSMDEVLGALKETNNMLNFRMCQKGRRIFVSRHEIDGIIDEEVREFKDLLPRGSFEDMKKELLDIAVAAIWGIVSINSDKIHW